MFFSRVFSQADPLVKWMSVMDLILNLLFISVYCVIRVGNYGMVVCLLWKWKIMKVLIRTNLAVVLAFGESAHGVTMCYMVPSGCSCHPRRLVWRLKRPHLRHPHLNRTNQTNSTKVLRNVHVYIGTTSFTCITTGIEIGQGLHPQSHMTSRLLSITNLNPEILQCAAWRN